MASVLPGKPAIAPAEREMGSLHQLSYSGSKVKLLSPGLPTALMSITEKNRDDVLSGTEFLQNTQAPSPLDFRLGFCF